MKEENVRKMLENIANDIVLLLHVRLGSELTESDLASLSEEVINVIKNATHLDDTEESDMEVDKVEGKLEKMKNSIDYINYKCSQIEKLLRACDRQAGQRDRLFRDRSPLRRMFGR
jgi:hypothetical protein